MSPISDLLEKEFAEAADRGTPTDLGNLAEKFSVEAISACAFGVKAGSFDTKGQTEFCKKVYGLFVYNVVDFLNMLAMEVPWMRSFMQWLRIPVNKSVGFINDTLLNLMQHKKQANNRCILTSAFHF